MFTYFDVEWEDRKHRLIINAETRRGHEIIISRVIPIAAKCPICDGSGGWGSPYSDYAPTPYEDCNYCYEGWVSWPRLVAFKLRNWWDRVQHG